MKFKHKYIHKFYAFALAAVFALTLAGCGGGGGSGTAEPPMTGPTDEEIAAEAAALEAAQNAAKAAYTAAMTAVDGVMADASVDPDSYAAARIALTAAKAASDAAAAATTSEAAKAEQAKAEAAQADAEKYAGMVADAKTAADQAEMDRQQEAMALDTAKQAAKTAADMAASLLADAEANKAHDIDSYVRAKVANEAAQEALAMANAATTSEAAKAAQADVEAALADVQRYADMVADAKTAADNLAAEMSAIRVARGAAEVAANAAQAALDAIAGQGDADSVSYNIAMRALEDALAAKVRAENAETAADAEAAQMAAESALADARKYASMVTVAHMEATALSTAQGAAMQAYMDAKAALAALTDEQKAADEASYARAEDAVADAKAANDEAAAATTSADAEAAQAKAETAKAAVERFAGMVVAAKEEADRVAEEKRREEEEMEEAAAAKKAMNEMVKTKADAITAESTATPDATSPAFDDTDAADQYTLKISHKSGSVSVEVTDPALPLKNDPKFVMMDGKYVRDNGKGVSEIVSVMTDIEAPESEPFSSVYTLTVGDADPERTGDQRTTYELDETADVGKVASSRISSAPTTTTNLPADDTTTENRNEGEFRGTFDGAAGTFECVNAACTAVTDADGKITTITGEWQFKPDAGAMVSVADDDYLHYGFWLMKTVKDGKTTYDAVQTFAGSSLDANTNIGSVVAGSAKYEGGAHGVYVYNTVNPDNSLDARSAGTFTADVALTAYFGAETSVAADKHNSVHGTISDFELSGGEANEWEVTMATASGVLSSASITGTSKGMASDTSTWSGTFSGDGEAVGTGVAPPPVLVGEFNSNFSNGAVAGAFGTRYMKE